MPTKTTQTKIFVPSKSFSRQFLLFYCVEYYEIGEAYILKDQKWEVKLSKESLQAKMLPVLQ